MQFEDLTGKKFGKLTVVGLFENKTGLRHSTFECICDCGEKRAVSRYKLTIGDRRSCGCAKDDSKKRQPIVGARYGKLVVIEIGLKDDKNGKGACICKCDCGVSKKIRNANILRARCLQSCGCAGAATTRGARNPLYRGVGLLPSRVFSTMVNNAKKREIRVTIVPDDAWALFQKQEGKCALTGVPISFGSTAKAGDRTASLDRIDSSKHYEHGNIQWVHRDINRMKQEFSQDEFIQWCQKVADYSRSMPPAKEPVSQSISELSTA